MLIEYGLPFNDQRIDLLLIGGKSGAPAAHIVELKNWETSRASSRLEHFVEVGAGGLIPHPSYQALNYAGKLSYLHSFGPSLEVSQSALIIDGGPERHQTTLGPQFTRFLFRAPLFVAPQLVDWSGLLRDRLPEAPAREWVEKVVNGKYEQSARLLDAIRDRQSVLKARASEILASCGWGLSKDQLLLCDEILATVQRGERAVFCVSGGPGSGKSLLAMNLFLGAVGMGKQTILAVRNNRLNEALREILNREVIGAQGMIKYFSTGRGGVEDDSTEVADLLVCDEGQRLALRSPNVFLRAPVVVILYDEKQVLNETERGILKNFFALCGKIGVAPQARRLTTPHRCRGGAAYLEWVEALLTEPGRLCEMPRTWLDDYTFEVASSPEDLLARLRFRPGRTGLLASFTRSSGRPDSRNPRDLGKIRVPETQPPVRWLMEPRRDYVPFYLEGRSTELTTCASIYGAQGFELDHAGLFWGTDMVIRKGKWTVGNPEDCYDQAPGARALRTVMRDEPELALQLLRNRYRILLTRGILGTAIYCEDAETRGFFQSLV
ncbi:MAG: DNA/RNA helicase domain-containing protein [Betaproteobacteria bacterium]